MLAYQYKAGDDSIHELVVLNPEAIPLLKQQLYEGDEGLVTDAFFIAHEQLIFVEGKNTLNSFIIEN